MSAARPAVAAARRVVVKVGSSSLTSSGVGLEGEAVDALVDALAAHRAAGHEVVQAGGLERGARPGVVAGGRSLVDDDDGELAAGGRRSLLRPERRGQAGRAGADDEDVDAVHDYASLAALTSCGTTVSRSPTTPKSA